MICPNCGRAITVDTRDIYGFAWCITSVRDTVPACGAKFRYTETACMSCGRRQPAALNAKLNIADKCAYCGGGTLAPVTPG